MGRSLIFKNADFSANAIGSNYVQMALTQGGVFLIPTGSQSGDQSGSDTSNYAKRINFTNAFYWQMGQKLKIRGLKGLDGTSDSLCIDGGIYSSSSWSHSTYVSTMNGGTTNYYPINMGGTEDEIELTNTWGNYWFVLSFKHQDGTQTLTASDFSPMEILVY